MRAIRLLVVALLATGTGAAAQQGPTFRASVDLIAVDVQVTRSSGEPIAELVPADFDVRIDGRPRRVVSAQFVRAGAPRTSVSLQGAGPFPTNEWPVGGGPDRTFILAFDIASIRASDSGPIIDAVSAFVDRVPGNDLIGLVALPNGARVDPTTDRAKVRGVLRQMVGSRRAFTSSFRLTLPEVIDITSRSGPIRAMIDARQRGAADLFASPAGETVRTVQRRECEGDPQCPSLLLADAEMLAQQMEQDAARSLSGLANLLTLLQDYGGRKTVVLVSGGMPSSDLPGGRPDIGDSASGLGEHAARANAIIYTLHIDRSLRDSVSAGVRSGAQDISTSRERRVQAKVLEDFTYPSGGAVLTAITDDGERGWDRVLRETSGYYLLGVEPTGVDRDGRIHRLQVSASANGATIRHRRWVVVTPPGGR